MSTGKELLRCFLAEMLGTFMLVLLGESSVAQAVLTKQDTNVTIVGNGTIGTFTTQKDSLNNFLTIILGHCFGVTIGVYVAGGVSGGHINPAVTFAMAIIGRLPWSRVLPYMIGQMLGGFLACPIIYAIYFEAVKAAGDDAIGIWSTYPYKFTSVGMAAATEIVGVFILVLVIMALTDSKNLPPHKGCLPPCVGLAVLSIGLAFGVNTGFALNPARDLSPRIWEGILFGKAPFTRTSRIPYYFWVPALMPFAGAILGAVVYILFIELHQNTQKKEVLLQ